MNLSKTRVVIVGAGQAGGRAAEALLSKPILLDSEPNPTFIRAPDPNVQIVGHPGGDEIIRGDVANGVGVNAARDMSVPRRLFASRKTVHRTDFENPGFELKRSLAS